MQEAGRAGRNENKAYSYIFGVKILEIQI